MRHLMNDFIKNYEYFVIQSLLLFYFIIGIYIIIKRILLY